MIVGYRLMGNAPAVVQTGAKVASGYYMPETGLISKVSIYLDGLGGGDGTQKIRAVIYDSQDSLMVVSDEVLVLAGALGAWVDFDFSGAAAAMSFPQGLFLGGFIAGGDEGVARWYKASRPAGLGGEASGVGTRKNYDDYSDGPSATFGSSDSFDALVIGPPVMGGVSFGEAGVTLEGDPAREGSVMSWFVQTFSPNHDLLPSAPDLYYARLPFDMAQAIFSAGATEASSAVRTRLGWHHTFADPEQGSNALVRDGGPLMGLLGERIKISAKRRIVYAYVHGVLPADSLEDISVTRLLYSKLSTLSDDNVAAVVDVVT